MYLVLNSFLGTSVNTTVVAIKFAIATVSQYTLLVSTPLAKVWKLCAAGSMFTVRIGDVIHIDVYLHRKYGKYCEPNIKVQLLTQGMMGCLESHDPLCAPSIV